MQRALMQFFKPENYFEVREALMQANRPDLIGGCDGLIPAQPPKEAIEARRRLVNPVGDHYHTVANPAKGEARASAEPSRRRLDTVRGGRRSEGGRGKRPRMTDNPDADTSVRNLSISHPLPAGERVVRELRMQFANRVRGVDVAGVKSSRPSPAVLMHAHQHGDLSPAGRGGSSGTLGR